MARRSEVRETAVAEESPAEPQEEVTVQVAATAELVKEARYRFRSRKPLIWIASSEERRVEAILKVAGPLEKYTVCFWDCASGATGAEGEKIEIGDPAALPGTVFDKVRAGLTGEIGRREIWVLRDLHHWLKDPMNLRALKSLCRRVEELNDKSRLIIFVVITPEEEIHVDLRGVAMMWSWPLPTRPEVAEVLASSLMAAKKRVPLEGSQEGIQRWEEPEETRSRLLACPPAEFEERSAAIVDAALGLTVHDISDAFVASIVRHRKVDPAVIMQEKRSLISQVPGLTWYPPDPRGFAAIGGLDLLKEALTDLGMSLTLGAKAFGLSDPRGVLLAGPPGTGKSLAAKACATAFNVPLIKLDLPAMKGGTVGTSEANIRRALRIISTVGKCVLWADEIDGSIPASGDYSGDSGVSKDFRATLLNFLQEHTGFIFLLATTNNPTQLPTELTRAGRFDATFFCDLPGLDDRAEVLAVTLRALPVPRDPALFDLQVIARQTADYSGAELAAVVDKAMRKAFRAGRELSTGDMLAAAGEMVPVSRSAAERLAELREWGRRNARPASSVTSTTSSSVMTPHFRRPLELDPSILDEDEEIS